METLEGSRWDIVIAGTGIRESLLALALSRSGKSILHVDKNDNYGGQSSALTLEDAEKWVEEVNGDVDKYPFTVFRNASIATTGEQDSSKRGATPATKLGSPRSYSLALSPELLYARSTLISTLVSTRIDKQLEFLAMGSWWVYTQQGKSFFQKKSQDPHQIPNLKKVPNGREDLFEDESIVSRSKRSLIKFLRFVVNFEEQGDQWEPKRQEPFTQFLQSKFGLSGETLDGVQALAMSSFPAQETTTEYALPRVARHLRSIGVFGPGFGAVLPKYGGLAEIAQVGCRACAVGGGVYVLGNGVKEVSLPGTFEQEVKEGEEASTLKLKLAEGDTVFTNWLVSSQGNMPSGLTSTQGKAPAKEEVRFSRSVSIVSSPLEPVFPPLAEDSPPPTGAVIVLPGSVLSSKKDSESTHPVHIIVHSSETGECPQGQCILYASTALPSAFSTLTTAINLFLASIAASTASTTLSTTLQSLSLGSPASKPSTQSSPSSSSPTILWCMQYEQRCPKIASTKAPADRVQRVPGSKDRVLVFEPEGLDLVFEDAPVLEGVKEVWKSVLGCDGVEEVDEARFMKFGAREGEQEGEA